MWHYSIAKKTCSLAFRDSIIFTFGCELASRLNKDGLLILRWHRRRLREYIGSSSPLRHHHSQQPIDHRTV